MCYYAPYILLAKNADIVKKEWNSGLRWIIASGVLGIFGYMLILVSFTIERVSYSVGLKQISNVFAVLVESHFFKEKHKGIRLTGSLIIFTGGFLISLAK
jgi:uncharacterized membrane protein